MKSSRRPHARHEPVVALGAGVFVSITPSVTMSLFEAASMQEKLQVIRGALADGHLTLRTADGEIIMAADGPKEPRWPDGG